MSQDKEWQFDVRTAKGEWKHFFTTYAPTREQAINDAEANIGGWMRIRDWRVREGQA